LRSVSSAATYWLLKSLAYAKRKRKAEPGTQNAGKAIGVGGAHFEGNLTGCGGVGSVFAKNKISLDFETAS
jgi:hypothetical protein